MIALAGVAFGVVVAAFSMRYLSALLFGVRPFDPPTIASVCAVLVMVALVASYLPARRASRLDPATILRAA